MLYKPRYQLHLFYRDKNETYILRCTNICYHKHILTYLTEVYTVSKDTSLNGKIFINQFFVYEKHFLPITIDHGYMGELFL